ncbi:MAG: FAD-dependent oxidoreductase, partial [Pseudomonadota bacterium]
MSRVTDVVVIGAGIIGLLTTYYLVKRGYSVCLLDRNEPGREASWAGGGILSPIIPWEEPKNLMA